VALTLPKNVTGEYFTRGNSSKLLVKRCSYELRLNFFSNRIVNMWNSLPDYVPNQQAWLGHQLFSEVGPAATNDVGIAALSLA